MGTILAYEPAGTIFFAESREIEVKKGFIPYRDRGSSYISGTFYRYFLKMSGKRLLFQVQPSIGPKSSAILRPRDKITKIAPQFNVISGNSGLPVPIPSRILRTHLQSFIRKRSQFVI